MEDQLVDIGEDTYIVESEKIKDKWYTCYMHTGYCSCPVGSTCAPCKHKSAVAKYTGKANFTVSPNNDPCQRALYHYIAWGRTLQPHMYRNINDPISEPQINEFITKILNNTDETLKQQENKVENISTSMEIE